MAEWSIAAVLKTVDRKIRGFESLSLRWVAQVSWLHGSRGPLRVSYLFNLWFLGEVPEWTIGAAC